MICNEILPVFRGPWLNELRGLGIEITSDIFQAILYRYCLGQGQFTMQISCSGNNNGLAKVVMNNSSMALTTTTL